MHIFKVTKIEGSVFEGVSRVTLQGEGEIVVDLPADYSKDRTVGEDLELYLEMVTDASAPVMKEEVELLMNGTVMGLVRGCTLFSFGGFLMRYSSHKDLTGRRFVVDEPVRFIVNPVPSTP